MRFELLRFFESSDSLVDVSLSDELDDDELSLLLLLLDELDDDDDELSLLSDELDDLNIYVQLRNDVYKWITSIDVQQT